MTAGPERNKFINISEAQIRRSKRVRLNIVSSIIINERDLGKEESHAGTK